MLGSDDSKQLFSSVRMTDFCCNALSCISQIYYSVSNIPELYPMNANSVLQSKLSLQMSKTRYRGRRIPFVNLWSISLVKEGTRESTKGESLTYSWWRKYNCLLRNLSNSLFLTLVWDFVLTEQII